MPRDPDKQYRYTRLVGTLGTIPLMLGVGPVLGWFIGRWLDDRLGTEPWLQVVLVGMGLAAAIRYIIGVLREARKDIDRM